MPKKTGVLTPLERRIMPVLWDGGAANVQKVLEGLTGEPHLAYTTVQTTLNVLHRKGKVKRKLVGRAYEYSSIVSQEAADSHATKGRFEEGFSRVSRRPSPVSRSEQAARGAKTRGVTSQVASQ